MSTSPGGSRPKRLQIATGTRSAHRSGVVIGDGPDHDEYVCGGCFAIVVTGLDIGRLAGALVRCSSCGILNEADVMP
jgi:hypothetical protein